MSLALGLGGPQSSALQCQAPWEGTLRDQNRFRVSPQEAGRPEPMAVWRVEEWPEMRVLGNWSIGPVFRLGGALRVSLGARRDLPVLRP